MKTDTIQPRCLKTTEAAQYLGISPRSLLDMTRAHRIPHIRLGIRTICYEIADLDAFVDARRVNASTK